MPTFGYRQYCPRLGVGSRLGIRRRLRLGLDRDVLRLVLLPHSDISGQEASTIIGFTLDATYNANMTTDTVNVKDNMCNVQYCIIVHTYWSGSTPNNVCR